MVREAAGGSRRTHPDPGELGRGRGVGPGCPADRVGALAPGGIPQRPGAWLATVARHRAVDRLRRDARYRDKLAQLQGWQPSPQADDRLRLMFSCCHPALSRQAQLALTLRAVCGFTTAQIAHALVASEAAIAQRLGRARRKIVTAAIPYRIPGDDDLDERLAQVLAVLCLLCNEGYLASGGRRPARRDLAEDAAWLAAQLATLYPRQPEALGLLALMGCTWPAPTPASTARRAGPAVPPGPQPLGPGGDHRGGRHPGARGQARAARPYQLQAAIVACHTEAATWAATDWPQILALYDLLLALTPSPVVALHRAVAVRQVAGPRAALEEVEALAPRWTATTCSTPSGRVAGRARPARAGPGGRTAGAGADRQPRRAVAAGAATHPAPGLRRPTTPAPGRPEPSIQRRLRSRGRGRRLRHLAGRHRVDL